MVNKDEVSAGGEPGRLVLDSYGRLSQVPETGELEKIETQHADNRKVIGRVGGTLGIELSDGLSAWKRGVRRKGWEALLARVESGESDGCVVWHTDRLFRQPRDLEALIDLAENGYKVFSAHGARDLADPDDRFILRIEVAHAARSSDDTSRRLKRRFETFRSQGRETGGPRRFGFPGKDLTWVPAEYETKADRPEVSAKLVERERQALRDAATLLLSEGGSGKKVADQWNAAGIHSVYGLEWIPATVVATLKRASLGGHLVHDGKIVGRLEGERILDKRTYDRLQAFFAGRKRGRVPGLSYIGTGILRCGRCGSKLTARKDQKGFYADGTQRSAYICARHRRGCGKIFIDRAKVDAELLAFTVARLSDERQAARLASVVEREGEQLKAIAQEISEVETLQRSLSERLGRRKITLDAFDAANEPLAADLARLNAERETLSAGATAGPTEASSSAELEAEWLGGDVAVRRAMLTKALGLDKLCVMPGDLSGRRVFDRERLKVHNSEEFANVVAAWHAQRGNDRA
ncbi:recombinase family protein [Amycolatopsis sp. NPDC005232]|uniref:recombinase family protein n=1 Tax=Amycolatopsis sp. NPDC005232 TaxID=3157027 RepID=UPI0033B4677C